MNLNCRSHTEIRPKIKISFVYAIFLETKLNYNHPAVKQNCFIDTVRNLTLRSLTQELTLKSLMTKKNHL